MATKSVKCREIPIELIAGQGLPRSSILVLVEIAYALSYYSLIVTLDRGALDPDPDQAGYPAIFVDLARSKICGSDLDPAICQIGSGQIQLPNRFCNQMRQKQHLARKEA